MYLFCLFQMCQCKGFVIISAFYIALPTLLISLNNAMFPNVTAMDKNVACGYWNESVDVNL